MERLRAQVAAHYSFQSTRDTAEMVRKLLADDAFVSKDWEKAVCSRRVVCLFGENLC